MLLMITPEAFFARVHENSSSCHCAMKRQASLFDAWHQPSPKAARTCTNERLSKRVGSEAFRKFEEQLEGERHEEALLLKKRAQRRADRERCEPGELQDPSTKGRGFSSRTTMGRPKGRAVYKRLGIKNHRRELGGPVLRRDRTAFEKLAILTAMDARCTAKTGKGGEGDWTTLSSEDKRAIEKRYLVAFEHIALWNKKRVALQHFVAKHRIGKHGLLPCGSRGQSLTGTKSQGKRLQDPVKEARKPLFGITSRMKRWLKSEREFNHEVRKSHVVERFLYEAEYERDKQLVLQEHGSEEFRPKTLERVREVLSEYRILHPSKKQDAWFTKSIMPNIGGRVRAAQRLSAKPTALDEVKARLSWSTCDWFQSLVMRGTPEQLSEFVSRPVEFCEARESTSFVVMDQVPLWLKLRGEEKLVYSADETVSRAARKRQSRAFKKAQDNETRAAAAQAAAETAEANPEYKGQGTSTYSTGGDKHRVTLVNMSGVRGWFAPNEIPRACKSKQVLLVPSKGHCKLEYIDSEGKWNRDWQVEQTDGEIIQHKNGETANNSLLHWRLARDKILELDPGHQFEFEVWGQPKAWTDEVIASWIVEFISAEWGQAMVLSDCLAAQWTEPVLLRAWLHQVIWTPLAPDVTSYLAEPDTHEHAQMKAEIRSCKAELHRAYELAWMGQRPVGCRDTYTPKWGPFELYTVLEKGLKGFKAKNPRVPLEGLIKNQFLIVRPSLEGRLEKIDESAEWAVPVLPPTRGIPNREAVQRLRDVAEWVDNRPPRPDWEQLDTANFHLAEVPNEPAEPEVLELEMEVSALQLSEHQRKMLLPPSARIRQIEYPDAIRKKTSVKKSVKRKSIWAAKFRQLFVGKGRKTWAKAFEKHGKEHVAGALNLEPKRKPAEKTRKPTATEIEAAVEKRFGKTLSKLLIKKRTARNGKKKIETAKGMPVEESEWSGQVVRVVADVPEEGRAGHVLKVYSSGTEGIFRLQVIDEGASSGTFAISTEHVVKTDGKAVDPKMIKPFKVDWRKVRAQVRNELANQLVGSDGAENLELMQKNAMAEQSSINALCKEIEVRCDLGPEFLIFPPSVSTGYSSFEQGEDDIGGEMAKFRELVANTSHVFFVVWAEGPRHYTYLYTRKPEAGAKRFIEFKDSLKPGAESSRAAATKLLKNLKIGEECPAPGNRGAQTDGWSCGLWVARWIERQVREILGEPRLPPTSLLDTMRRGNDFVDKIRGAKAKAKAKAKAEPKGEKSKKEYKTHEPVHATLEEALKAGLECSKCLPTKMGTKGCRACMGEHFEDIRQRGFEK